MPDTSPPRIFKVRYRSAINGRVAIAFVKVPYGGMFGLTEMLTRQQLKGQILYFRIDVATPKEISENRDRLSRWLGALMESSVRTKVDWMA